MSAARQGGGEELLEHRAWLKQQQADLQEHLRRKRQRPPPHRLAELEDFAVGSDIGLVGADAEEEVLYRSVTIDEHRDWDEERLLTADARHGSPPAAAGDVSIFRSLDSLGRGGEGESAEDESTIADWLATGRPPLLKRQRAFHHDSSWLGLTP